MQKLKNSFTFPKLHILQWGICLGLVGSSPIALAAQLVSQEVQSEISFSSYESVLQTSDGVVDKYPFYLYEEYRKTPSPINGVKVKLNPTELQWPSVKVWEHRDVTYNVYLSQDSSFPQGQTMRGESLSYCFYNPHKALKPGVWYWKYEIVDKRSGEKETKGVYSFMVEEGTEKFETPTFEEFISNVNSRHPRVINKGNDL